MGNTRVATRTTSSQLPRPPTTIQAISTEKTPAQQVCSDGRRPTHPARVAVSVKKTTTSARFWVTSGPYSDTKLAARRAQAAVRTHCKNGCFAEKDGFRRSAGGRKAGQ